MIIFNFKSKCKKRAEYRKPIYLYKKFKFRKKINFIILNYCEYQILLIKIKNILFMRFKKLKVNNILTIKQVNFLVNSFDYKYIKIKKFL